MKLSKRKVDRAINILIESQQSHQRCIDYPETESMGDPEFHREAVKEYEQVLKVLRKVRKEL